MIPDITASLLNTIMKLFRSFNYALSAFPLLAATAPAAESTATPIRPERITLVAPDARYLAASESLPFTVAVPELDGRDKNVPGDWRGVISVDLHGTLADGKGGITVELLDADGGKVLASSAAEIEARPALAPWAVIFSSATPRWPANKVFSPKDRQPWFAEQRKGEEEWVGIEYARPTRMTGLVYGPSGYRGASGVAKEYRVEIRKPGSATWETLVSGERTENPWSPMDLKLPQPVDVEAFRMVIETDWIGIGGGSANQIDLPGVELPPVQQINAPKRAWVEIPPAIAKQHEGKPLALRVRNHSKQAVAIGAPRFTRVHVAPDHRLLGGTRIGAGLVGFNAISQAQQTVNRDTACASPPRTWAPPTWARKTLSTPPTLL